ncbi:C40 family peptidase [Paenibacillus nasutitermitis]|uniref:NlpC/P60 domain-containing protein n=1 Tax=Paenibacillus nasutitermitis TaxID=1652958 RepID=A0A917DWK7_9BACL|nr:C40 family peptidase [Paenibacillus nasutitermitis]GGD74527.1 hypothetical protein GCM10010911_35540 [Paenibacillus nasutitermitis]
MNRMTGFHRSLRIAGKAVLTVTAASLMAGMVADVPWIPGQIAQAAEPIAPAPIAEARHNQRNETIHNDRRSVPATINLKRRSDIRLAMVKDAHRYLETPYVWGGTKPSPGFDCSGFVYFMFNKFGISQKRTTASNLYRQGYTIHRSSLRPGDLVFFKSLATGRVNHVGFYIGDNAFISATSSRGIDVQRLESTYWSPRYAGARRL